MTTVRLHVNSISEEGSLAILRTVTTEIEGILSPVARACSGGPVNTLHLLTICVSDDPKEQSKFVEANHKVHRAKGPSGRMEQVVAITVPLRPKDLAKKSKKEATTLYVTTLLSRLSLCSLKLPEGFSLDPFIERLKIENAAL